MKGKDMFSPVPNSTVLISINGVYSERDLYEINGVLYAQIGSGFVRLKPYHETSKPKTHWVKIQIKDAELSIEGGQLTYVYPTSMAAE